VSIFDNAFSRPTHHQVIDTIRPLEIALTADKTGARRQEIDRRDEWFVELRLRQNYWANNAQRPDFEKAALRCLAADLYADVLRELPRLRLAIMSGDKAGAMAAVDRIDAATQP
jgi:hypothetical protein